MWSAWRQSNYAFFKKHLDPLPRSLSLVDLGTGKLQFRDLFTSFDYTGIDFEKYPGVTIVADLNEGIPLPDNSADIITLSNVLEHIPQPEPLIAECKRVLKPGGLLIGTVPFLVQVHQAPYDFNRYTYYQLERFFKDFDNVQVVPLGSLIDAYNTIELKFFDHFPRFNIIRLLRRLEMRLMRSMFLQPSTIKMTEGYGFVMHTPR